ncbi:helix-turn-helix domain-containing protein [Roseateles sp. LKC17W]|uniref:Helix-turn-helix domain-containing protein n=1 Tax=Pelomonas margarita TaxID=3299031 RepID=A0ABW7FDT1_9BURK
MQRRKPVADPQALGAALRERRKSLGKTLTEIAEITSVDVGQLSRIENGQMRRDGGNLQKYITALQKLEATRTQARAPSVVERFAAIVGRSNRHAEAATAFVDALERLM